MPRKTPPGGPITAMTRRIGQVEDRFNERLAALVEAQHALVAQLADVLAKAANPPISVPSGPIVGGVTVEAMRQQQAAAYAREYPVLAAGLRATVPRGTAAETPATAGDAYDAMRREAVLSERLAEDVSGMDTSTPLEVDGALIEDPDELQELTANGMSPSADPVEAMYAELAAYQQEDETPPPPTEEAELWSRRMSAWRGSRVWHADWGPRPGQEGCQAPAYMMGGRR